MVDILGTIATGFSNMGRVVSDSINQTQPVGGYQFDADRIGGDQGFGGGGAGGRDGSVQAAQVVIPADTYFDSSSESGAVSKSTFPTDTSAPQVQTFLDTYVPEARITTRAGYTTGDRGDTKTALIEKEYGYSPMQALAMQEDAAKAAGKIKEARYYRGEWERAQQDVGVGASQESYEKAKSSIAQAPNTQEYAADLAQTALWRSQGVVNVPGTTRDTSGAVRTEFKPYEGSMLAESNVITKAMRTGDMGPYGTLGKPFSAAYGILDLDTQQAISRQAAKTAGWNYEAENVVNPVREKYENPLVLTGRGLNMFYKEATPKGIAPELLSTKYNPAKTSERLAQLALMKPGIADINRAAEAEVISPVIQGPNEEKGNVRSVRPIQNVIAPDVVKSSAGVINTASLAKFSNVVEPKGEQVSIVDAEMRKTGIYIPGIIGLAEGGQLGGGKTVGGHTLDSVGILPLYRPPGMGPLKLYRRSQRVFPFIRRKHSSKPLPRISYSEPKHDPKIFNLESINKNILPKSLGADLFKFNLNSSDKLVKSIGVRSRVQDVVKIKGDTLGLAQVKDIAGNIKVSNFGVGFSKGKGVSAVSGNINALVKNMLNPVKIRKIKLK